MNEPSRPQLSDYRHWTARSCVAGPLGIWEGLTAAAYGLRLLRRHPFLWRSIAFSLCAQVFLSLALLVAWVYACLQWIRPALAGSSSGVTAHIIGWSLTAILLLAGLFFVAILGVILGMALSPVAYMRLTDEVERLLGGARKLTPLPVTRQFAESLINVAEFCAINTLLLVLGFVPALGVFCSIAGFLYNAWFLGLSFLEYPQILRGMPRRERRAAAPGWAAVGLGVGPVFWNAIPLVGAILSTTSVVGAVVLWNRFESGRVEK